MVLVPNQILYLTDSRAGGGVQSCGRGSGGKSMGHGGAKGEAKGGWEVIIEEPHKHEGIFIARAKRRCSS